MGPPAAANPAMPPEKRASMARDHLEAGTVNEVPPIHRRCQVHGCFRWAEWRCDNGFRLCLIHRDHWHLTEGLRKLARAVCSPWTHQGD